MVRLLASFTSNDDIFEQIFRPTMGHLYSAHCEGELIKGVLIPGEMALWELLSHLWFIYEQHLSCHPAEVWNEFIKLELKKN